MVLVRGVEGNLGGFSILLPKSDHLAFNQLHRLEDGRLGGVAGALALHHRNVILAGEKLGSAAKLGDQREGAEGFGGSIEAGSGLLLGGVRIEDGVVEPEMADGHSILRQRAGLVGADGRGGAQRFDGLEVLHQAVLLGHALCGEGEADGDGGQEAFRDVGDDDADEEDDGIEPVVAEDEGDDEEGDAEEDGHASDDVDEVLDLREKEKESEKKRKQKVNKTSAKKMFTSLAIGVSPISSPEARFAIRPIKVRSPVLMTMPRPVPSTQFVEKKAMFFVSSGLGLVHSGLRDCGSDSPVSELLSTLKPEAEMTRMSAGIRSPPFTSIRSPTTTSSTGMVNFWPFRTTVAYWGIMFLKESMILLLFASW